MLPLLFPFIYFTIIFLITTKIKGNSIVDIGWGLVFVLQGIFNFIVGSVSYSIIKYNQFDFSMSHNYIVIISLLIAVIGLFVEVVGDEQLR